MYDSLLKKVHELKIIIYARLSKEEEKQSFQEQSKSIKNQIELCREFIENEKNEYLDCKYTIIDELYDDGVSGTTFDREDFNKVIKLIENKKVNMLITKDLSRLGRDHILTDNYIEKWFPENNVRYVSILEGIDTYNYESISNDIAPIINWSNDQFAKTTSKKIRKQFQKMMKNGIWTGGEPPLGYKLENKHFVIDENGSNIVKRIFKLALEGKKSSDICKILNEQKIPLPSLMKKSNRKININLWSLHTINRILKNEIYIGNMVQGKTTKLNYKSNKIIYLPKNEWNIIKNTHEAIIDQQTFENVQILLKSNKNKIKNSYNYLLKGLMYCQECNHTIGIQHFNNRRVNYTICNLYRKYGKKSNLCTAHRFKYEEIEQLVLDNIKKDLKDELDYNYLIDLLKKDNFNNNSELLNDIEISKNNIKKYQKYIDIIYQDKLDGIISKEEFLRIKSNQLLLIAEENKKIEENTDKLKKNKKKINYQEIVEDFLNLKNINNLIINKLVNKILINSYGEIEIYYSYKK